MRKCWASILGNCSSKITREHIVSESLFATDVVTARGFSWCDGGEKTIGMSSLTAKILCERHNNELSPLDAAASQAFTTFRELARLYEVRLKMKARRWTVVHDRIDGRLLERWFLKTLINMCIDSSERIGPQSVCAGVPDESLVKIAFGRDSFHGRAGLYGAGHAGQNIRCAEELHANVLVKNAQVIGGALFQFRGFCFLLFLDEGGPPPELRRLKLGDIDWSKIDFSYHQMRIRVVLGGYLSQVVQMFWK
jgi:hypothetical protein